MTLRERLVAPTSAAPLVWFRIIFGLMMAYECARYLGFGWVRDYWIEPSFHFKFYGFEWVHPWPGEGMLLHFVALVVLGVFVAAGAFHRVSSALFTLGFAYVFLLDQAAYLNHFYAVILFSLLLTLAPASTALSVDAYRRPDSASATVPTWSIWALQAQMGFIYVFGGVAKLTPDWLNGQPLTMWLQSAEHLPTFFHGTAGLYLSWAGAAFDLLIVPALIWRPTRNIALVAALAFHLMNAWMFHIGIFPWMSLAATALFLDRDHWLFRPIRDRLPRARRDLPTPRWVATALVVWCATQLLLPLRPYVYPTNPHWSENGHRFAWHMKLRSKYATGTFWIQQDGRRQRVDPTEYLTERQLDKMLPRPDMVLQFAHHLSHNHPGAEVYALVHASLNGRPPAPLTDVEVDLAAEPRNLSPPHWVPPFRDTQIQALEPPPR